MGQMYKKANNAYIGWVIIAIMVLIIIATIFSGRFFKSEEKIKLAFENGQMISFFIAATNEQKLIKGGLVLLYHTETNRCALISILPRTYLLFGEHGYCTLEEACLKKINNEDILKGISKLINCDLDYYLFIEKENLIKLIDMIGGVQIYSENILKYHALKVYIPSGLTLLDGEKSMEYLSFIVNDEEGGEYKQLKRIQNFMQGVLMLKQNFLEQFNEYIISNYFYKAFNTNMSVNEFAIVYNEIRNRFKKDINDYSIGLINIILYCDIKNDEKEENLYFPKKSGDWIKSEVELAKGNLGKKFSENEEGNITLEILNGTDIVGLAARAKTYIESFGFDVSNVDNTDHMDYENTIIVFYTSEQKAKKIADLIHCKRIYNEMDNEAKKSKKIDVGLILGRDFDGKIVR